MDFMVIFSFFKKEKPYVSKVPVLNSTMTDLLKQSLR